MGLYRQEKVTLLMNDFGLRMANALPFKRQPDRMAQRVSDLSATDWRYETHKKLSWFDTCLVTAFLRDGRPCTQLPEFV